MVRIRVLVGVSVAPPPNYHLRILSMEQYCHALEPKKLPETQVGLNTVIIQPRAYPAPNLRSPGGGCGGGGHGTIAAVVAVLFLKKKKIHFSLEMDQKQFRSKPILASCV